MAARQTQIESMAPRERAEQEQWAQAQLAQNAGTCVAGFSWSRIEGGYRCRGGAHMVTDELLAEGKGGYYRHACPGWEGPIYPGAVFVVAPVVPVYPFFWI